jgi:hypothetical protein
MGEKTERRPDVATTTPSPPAWDDRLSRLLSTLTTELRIGAPGAWTGRTLRSGYRVALTIMDDGTRRVKVSTEDRPAKGNAPAWARHHEKVETILQHLGCAHWEREPIPALSTEAYFREPNLAGAA